MHAYVYICIGMHIFMKEQSGRGIYIVEQCKALKFGGCLRHAVTLYYASC